VPAALACTGAVPVDITFDRGSSLLTALERSKLESAAYKARAAASTGGLNVAFAIYSQDGEVVGETEAKRLTEQRVRALREIFATIGVEASAVVAVLGDSTTQKAPAAGAGGFAEIEIAFGCGGS
jgi:hypothetical protein